MEIETYKIMNVCSSNQGYQEKMRKIIETINKPKFIFVNHEKCEISDSNR
jgi:hypothetical protein